MHELVEGAVGRFPDHRSLKGSETQVRHQAPPVACTLFYSKELHCCSRSCTSSSAVCSEAEVA
jgi:hypothetical protein